LLAKVPEVTAVFWVVKVLTTGMGEAASDWLAAQSIALAAGIGAVGLGVTLWYQLRADRYRPTTYWATVAMVAVFGTMAADAIHVVLKVPYPITSAAYAIAVAASLVVWWRFEGTLSIHSITTRRRELFYWATVLATFALGTAAGDLTAMTLKLGLPRIRSDLPCRHPDPMGGMALVASERGGGVLGCVRPHPPFGRILRRLGRQTSQLGGRTRRRRRSSHPDPRRGDLRSRRLDRQERPRHPATARNRPVAAAVVPMIDSARSPFRGVLKA
jgi:hypothetical protein